MPFTLDYFAATISLICFRKSSAFFYENFRLIGEVGYWDESASLKPLLHFWSLAIEEQFYIFWPLILILLYKTRLNIVLTLFLLFLILFLTPMIVEIDKFYNYLDELIDVLKNKGYKFISLR